MADVFLSYARADAAAARVGYLMYSGRPAEVLELVRDSAERPLEITQDFADAVRATAEGLAGNIPTSAAVAKDLDFLGRNPLAALQVAQACAALGAADHAFAILDGIISASENGLERRPPAAISIASRTACSTLRCGRCGLTRGSRHC